MKTKRVSATVPILLGMLFGIFFSWSPGQSQSDTKVAPKRAHPAEILRAEGEVVLPDINGGPSVVNASPAERLLKAEVELYLLKLQRHKLQKSLQQMQQRVQKRRQPPPQRRPCT